MTASVTVVACDCARPGSTWHTVTLAGALCTLAACSSMTHLPASIPAPPLHLLSAPTFELPPDCEPARGTVYRTRFVVQVDGSVTRAGSEAGTGCVQDALREWVSSFRYAPVPEQTNVVFDWLAVTASRGG